MTRIVLLALGLSLGVAASQPASSITIEGDSTLHPYHLRATRLDVQLPPDSRATSLAERARAGQLGAIEVQVAAGAFSSGESGLDENFRKALQARKHPFLRFVLASYEVTPPAAGASFGLMLHGKLSVAGVDKAIDVPAQAFVLSDGSLRVTGALPLRMIDFKVEPPVLMLGMIRCKDEVTVRFDLVLGNRAAK